VVPMVIQPTGMPVYVDIHKGQEEAAIARLQELGRKHLSGVKYELLTHVGLPMGVIIRAQKQIPADVVIMATHGRRGLARAFLGSVAEAVVRDSVCPVLTVHSGPVDRHLVGHWMTTNPITTNPEEKAATVQKTMTEGKFRSMPVLEHGHLVGIITDRDLRERKPQAETIAVGTFMTRQVLTVTPRTSVWDAARLLAERKIGALPVLDDEGALLGLITTTDLLHAFYQMHED